MKKFVFLFSVCICFPLTANAQDPVGCTILGTAGTTLDPSLVPKFVNDLPVINDLGLRIDMTEKKSGKLQVKMEETFQDLLGMGYQTRVWGYRFPGLKATYPGATIFAMKDQPIEIKWKNKSYGIVRPVDLHVNCRVKRDENNMSDVIITTDGKGYKGGNLL